MRLRRDVWLACASQGNCRSPGCGVAAASCGASSRPLCCSDTFYLTRMPQGLQGRGLHQQP